MRVYLAGPVDPALLEECLRWRIEAVASMSALGMDGINPCRGGQHPAARDDGRITELPVDAAHLVSRDKADIRSCQAMLVYWPAGSDKRGIGTIMEIALAGQWSIPVLLVDPGRAISDHPWVEVHAADHHASVGAAIEALATYWHS